MHQPTPSPWLAVGVYMKRERVIPTQRKEEHETSTDSSCRSERGWGQGRGWSESYHLSRASGVQKKLHLLT